MGKRFNEALKKARGINVDTKYYADSYLDNIYGWRMDEKFVRMFCKGEGKELFPKDGNKEKAACIYSSSMLAYNFFHWINEDNPFSYCGTDYVKVVFEEQFRVLKNRNNRANLDVVLADKDGNTLLILESKFTEHMAIKDTCPEISDAYASRDSYFQNSNGDEWASIINKLQRENRGRAYYDGLKQVVCHLIGISSVICNEDARQWFNNNSWLKHIEGITLKGTERFIFKSIVFRPKMNEECRRSKEYENMNRDFIKGLNFLPDNLNVKDPILTYRDIWEAGMKESIQDPKLTEYLERYLIEHD